MSGAGAWLEGHFTQIVYMANTKNKVGLDVLMFKELQDTLSSGKKSKCIIICIVHFNECREKKT